MTKSNQDLRRANPGVIDQRQQQIDPAGKNRIDPDLRPDANSKQPGGSDSAKAKPAPDTAVTPARGD